MAMAIGNPDDLEALANALQAYLDALDDAACRMDGAYGQYSDSWQDANKQRFEDSYRDLQSRLRRFCDEASEQVPRLHGMAEHLREYQQS